MPVDQERIPPLSQDDLEADRSLRGHSVFNPLTVRGWLCGLPGRFGDWLLRLFGFSPWVYAVGQIPEHGAPLYHAILRRSKRKPNLKEYLTDQGEWADGHPPYIREKEDGGAITTITLPDHPAPIVYQTYEQAEMHVRRLEIGIPGRWPLYAAVLAIAAVVAAWLDACGGAPPSC